MLNNYLNKIKLFNSTLSLFYKKKLETIINYASIGWIYSVSIDHIYFEDNKKINKLEISTKDNNSKDNISIIKKDLTLNYNEDSENKNLLAKFLADKDEISVYKKLQQLTKQNNSVLTKDSFYSFSGIDFLEAQIQTFRNNTINVLIIGAGFTGLYLANVLKFFFGSKISILLVDNRCVRKNLRTKFDRNWLTNVNHKNFAKNLDPEIKDLLGSFGIDGQVGLPLNIIESILKLSCISKGTKFFYSPNYNFKKFCNKNIDTIFDATGGRLGNNFSLEENKEKTNYNLSIPRGRNLEINIPGINQNKKFLDPNLNDLNFTLRPSGRIYHPYFKGIKIQNHMIKLTNIQPEYSRKILYFLKKENYDNIFYLWNGELKKQINEALLFINISFEEKKLLAKIIDKSLELRKFYVKYCDEINLFDQRIDKLFKLLLSMKICDILIHKPFTYEPHINLNNSINDINEVQVFPIGDSLFSGNPKAGNGLSFHIKFINELVEELSNTKKNDIINSNNIF